MVKPTQPQPLGEAAASSPAVAVGTANPLQGDEILSTYRAELKLMAEVRAYFDLAYKVVPSIC